MSDAGQFSIEASLDGVQSKTACWQAVAAMGQEKSCGTLVTFMQISP